MMKTLAVANQKGGSAKTTTSVNLAAALAEAGRRVLVIDLDPQASSSQWLGVTDAGEELLDVLKGKRELEAAARPTTIERVSLVPSSPWLVGADKELAGEIGIELVLRRKLERVAAHGEFDYCLMDCPPQLGIFSISALVATREILVPVEAHMLALLGFAQLLETIETVRDRLNPELAIAGIVACRVDARNRHSREVVESLRAQFGSQVLNAQIRENIRLAEAPSFQQSILTYAPHSTGASDYRALAGELLERAGD